MKENQIEVLKQQLKDIEEQKKKQMLEYNPQIKKWVKQK